MQRTFNKKGIVLVMVLWVVLLLSTLIAEFTARINIEKRAAMHSKEYMTQYYTARSGMLKTIEQILNDYSLAGATQSDEQNIWIWNRWSKTYNLPWGDYRVMFIDETSKIDINGNNDRILNELFKKNGIDEIRRATILDSIKDWKDKNDSHRLNGAENDFYNRLEHPYPCKNGNFNSVSELIFVRGISRELLFGEMTEGEKNNGIFSFLTVYGGKGGQKISKININTSPVENLSFLPGFTDAHIDEIKKWRIEKNDLTNTDLIQIIGADVYALASPYISWRQPHTINIYLTALKKDGEPGAVIRAIINFTKGNTKNFKVLEWEDTLDISRLPIPEGDFLF